MTLTRCSAATADVDSPRSDTACASSFVGSGGSSPAMPPAPALLVHDPYSFEAFSEAPLSPQGTTGGSGKPTSPLTVPPTACGSPLCQPALGFHVSCCPAALSFLPSSREPPLPPFPHRTPRPLLLELPPTPPKPCNASPNRRTPPPTVLPAARRDRRKPQRPTPPLPPRPVPLPVTVSWKRYGIPVSPLEALQQLQRHRGQ
eukprot:EG_transcript_15976